MKTLLLVDADQCLPKKAITEVCSTGGRSICCVSSVNKQTTRILYDLKKSFGNSIDVRVCKNDKESVDVELILSTNELLSNQRFTSLKVVTNDNKLHESLKRVWERNICSYQQNASIHNWATRVLVLLQSYPAGLRFRNIKKRIPEVEPETLDFLKSTGKITKRNGIYSVTNAAI
ncbi:hypothetical protein [Vibrio barjaei]|uniref:hypothetical protein n=1 Tax=Vibrio barjaei TaxID=1676683 RepID=UPI002284BCE0|nr:hypothetical protein [Vibrio barjaei]MCY9872339.1 hypothetical protein [Vibrio barjaei]